MKTKEQKIRAHPAVESLEHEDENGWWAYLRDGWIDEESQCHAIVEDTLTDVYNKLRFVRRELRNHTDKAVAMGAYAAADAMLKAKEARK